MAHLRNDSRAWDKSLPPTQTHFACLRISALLLLAALPSAAFQPPPGPPSNWPQAYSVQRNKADGLLTLSTPYYTVQHDLKHGGAISSIRLTHGKASNLSLIHI